MSESEILELDMTIHIDLPNKKAIFASLDGNQKTGVWLPRSQVKYKSYGSRRPNVWRVEIAEWLALDKGLI